MDLVGLVAVPPYETLGVEDRGSKFEESIQGSQIQGREEVVHVHEPIVKVLVQGIGNESTDNHPGIDLLNPL